ncbi:Tricarboxylate transporter ALT9 [Paramyrothecium foliicola]|nr:Tricarboxylate transporter ALT9 [Paramyrothecium foliicola]
MEIARFHCRLNTGHGMLRQAVNMPVKIPNTTFMDIWTNVTRRTEKKFSLQPGFWTMSQDKGVVTPLQSVLAGAAAGGIESMITYPTEYIKTRQQLSHAHANAQSPARLLAATIRNDGFGRLYTGGAAFCVSNSLKSGIRFLAFDFARQHMPKDTSDKTTITGNLLAGLFAGIAESVVVLTPGENLKTKLIDDKAGPQLYRSSIHAAKTIIATDGPFSFFRGVAPVTLKQSSNAMVRFTSYDQLSTALKPVLGASTSVVAGAMAGVITLYCTMPLDNVKTRMQSLEGKHLYNGSWDCARKVVCEGGMKLLWKGTTPRLIRLSCDGGVPACGNCQKANEPCIDVDGRNNAVSIPRDFAANARARILWLEEQIQSFAPSFKLEEGPRVDFSFLDGASTTQQQSTSSPGFRDPLQAPLRSPSDAVSGPVKRPFAVATEESTQECFPDEARSVALDLGLLTLNSDSRQTHYLGTSSGRLFTSLIGAGSPESPSQARDGRSSTVSASDSPVRVGLYAHTKRTKESYRALFDTLRKSLPQEDDAQILLDVYFRNIHIDHPFLHPGSLLDAVKALYQCAKVNTTNEIGFHGWPTFVQPFSYNGEFQVSKDTECIPISVFTATFHVFMVFTLASTVRTRQRIYDFAPKQFYQVAMSVSPQCFSSTSTASLQATLLLAVHSILSPAELNVWTLTSIATIQGRPLGIRDETFDLELPAMEEIQVDTACVENKEFAPERSLTGGLAYTIHRFKLDPIISEIKLLFYHLPSQLNTYAWPSHHESSQAAIRRKLEEWRAELMAIASSFPVEYEERRLDHRKYEMKLTSQYFAAMIILYQPSQAIPQPSEQSLLICYQCAASRLNTYNNLYNADGYYQSWRSVQGVFSSGATMIYCLWTSDLVRRSVPILSVMKDLRTCTNLLSVGGEWWPSARKGKESFSRAMDALLKSLDSARHDNQRPQLGSLDGTRPKRRLGPSESMAEDLVFPQDTATGSESTEEHVKDLQDGTDFTQVSADYESIDWQVMGNDIFPEGTQPIYGLTVDMSQDSSDATVEAFLSEFLSGDTAWNPF